MSLDGLRQKAEIFTRGSREPAGSGSAEAFDRDLVVSEDEVEVAFLREQNKRRTA
jgi:hypothetical protein